MRKSILQPWVEELPLRMQGVLMSAVRGCDTAPRHDTSKILQRIYRSEILECSCGDPQKSVSYILPADVPTTVRRMNEFLEDCDHYPAHFVLHVVHAAEILGYYHPRSRPSRHVERLLRAGVQEVPCQAGATERASRPVDGAGGGVRQGTEGRGQGVGVRGATRRLMSQGLGS